MQIPNHRHWHKDDNRGKQNGRDDCPVKYRLKWQANAARDGFVPDVAERSALEAYYDDKGKSLRRNQETDNNAGNADSDDREDAHVKEED